MTPREMIEVALAALLILGGGWLYYRRGAEGEAKTGSQTAVILIFVGIIMAIHGLGLLEYRKPEVGL
jgi:hypothetical protein